MNVYPLTPPMDSPTSSMMSPDSDCRSPTHLFAPYQVPHIYYNAGVVSMSDRSEPFLRIREQPVDKFRFRYKSEMSGTHGSLNGKTSDRSRKQTFPSVELLNYDKQAIVRCSLYQYGREDMAHTRQLHAHRLVKKQGNEEIDDPHDVHVNSDLGYVANFHSMGIIHTARKYIVPELIRKMTILKQEEISRIEHKFRSLTKKEELEIKAIAEKESKCINLNVVCLRFDAYRIVNNIYYPICQPLYSPAINNLKSALTGDLRIVRMDHCTSPCRGGREIFILVEKVTKKNIKVRFFELDDEDNEVWEDYGRFSDMDVHHQYAIVFKTPPYKHSDIDKEVRVFIELQRPSDGARSEPKDFSYIPSEVSIGKKRTRVDSTDYSHSYYSVDELPVTLNTIAPSVDKETMPIVNSPTINSADLEAALKQNNIDSSEFDNLWSSLNGAAPMKDLFTAENVPIKELKSWGLVMDTPHLKSNPPSSTRTAYCSTVKVEALIGRIKSELISFLKTDSSEKRVAMMLESLVQRDDYLLPGRNNVFHIFATEIPFSCEFVSEFLGLLKKHQKTCLLNIKNANGQSPLHVAVECCNVTFIEQLLKLEVNLTVKDGQGNNPLHIAVLQGVPIDVLSLLLTAYQKLNIDVDDYNYDGKTPLHLSVTENNLSASKVLITFGANVNAAERKNGYTPVHLAIISQNIDILKYLLDSTKAECDLEDFAQYNAFKFARKLIDVNNSRTLEAYTVVESHLKKIGIFSDALLKECVHSEDEEDEDDTIDSNSEYSNKSVQNESANNDLKLELLQKYSEVMDFSEECKNSLSTILDKTHTWKRLGELLDFGHILQTDVFAAVQHPTRSLLTFAVANGKSVKEIRDCLASLDEMKAVEMIDKMVVK